MGVGILRRDRAKSVYERHAVSPVQEVSWRSLPMVPNATPTPLWRVGTTEAVGLGRVKTLEREVRIERPFSPAPMSQQEMAIRLEDCGAGRTRSPSVNALSQFSHNQGQSKSGTVIKLQDRGAIIASELSGVFLAPLLGPPIGQRSFAAPGRTA